MKKEPYTKVEDASYEVMAGIISLASTLAGIASWAYPVFNIWVDIIDKELTFINTLKYVGIGVLVFCASIGLNKIVEVLNKNTNDE